jgi:hypothetical protein
MQDSARRPSEIVPSLQTMRWIGLAGLLLAAGCGSDGGSPNLQDANASADGPRDAQGPIGEGGSVKADGAPGPDRRVDAGTSLDAAGSTDARGPRADAGGPLDASGPLDDGGSVDAHGLGDAGELLDAPARNDAGLPRSFLLATTGARLDTVDGFQLTTANLATDVDVVAMHQDFYGVPWDEFAASGDPPALWTAKMDALATIARDLGKPVFLSLSVLAGTRDAPAEQAVVQGGRLDKIAKGSRCQIFDAPMRSAYVNYVTWMVSRFNPRWVNVAVEMNTYRICPEAAWGSLVNLSNAAYVAAKTARPAVLAFPSFQIDQLYGTDPTRCGDAGADVCFEANYAAITTLKRDRFAVSTYPYAVDALKGRDLPSDWFTRAAERRGETTIIAETGWNSESVVARLGSRCLTAIPSSEDAELRYLERVMSDAESRGIELVTWWSNRDVIDARVMTIAPARSTPPGAPWWTSSARRARTIRANSTERRC